MVPHGDRFKSSALWSMWGVFGELEQDPTWLPPINKRQAGSSPRQYKAGPCTPSFVTSLCRELIQALMATGCWLFLW